MQILKCKLSSSENVPILKDAISIEDIHMTMIHASSSCTGKKFLSALVSRDFILPYSIQHSLLLFIPDHNSNFIRLFYN